MKKLLLFFTVAAAVISCDPSYDGWGWRVRNNTEQTLKFNFISQRQQDSPTYGLYNTVTIPPGGAYSIYGTETRTNGRDRMRFDNYFINNVNSYGEEVYWQILSEDDVVLKTWKYSDMEMPDQRFFEESSWSLDILQPGGTFVDVLYTWTFEILPKDIQSTNQ